jgi:hypothetical protein
VFLPEQAEIRAITGPPDCNDPQQTAGIGKRRYKEVP